MQRMYWSKWDWCTDEHRLFEHRRSPLLHRRIGPDIGKSGHCAGRLPGDARRLFQWSSIVRQHEEWFSHRTRGRWHKVGLLGWNDFCTTVPACSGIRGSSAASSKHRASWRGLRTYAKIIGCLRQQVTAPWRELPLRLVRNCFSALSSKNGGKDTNYCASYILGVSTLLIKPVMNSNTWMGCTPSNSWFFIVRFFM